MADIAINPVSRRVQFTGNTGTGPFAFTFNILADEDIVVYKNTTLLTLTTDYTVSTNADGTGSVTLVAALIASDVLTIIGGRELERTTDFVTAGDLLAASLNEQLDSIVIMAQQLDEKLTRAVKVNPGDVFTDLELPGKDARKGTVLGFNATSGDPEAGPEIADVQSLAAITADISTLADIEDGTDATDAIQTVAGISSDVTTVSGISANVTTVAGISSDVTAVAADATDIGTVATNIASVNTVATNIADVITVANDLNEAVSEVVTVADDLNEAVSEIDTVATSITNVDAVGANIANVNTVAGISGNVTTVAGISADTSTVAGISANVTTVAGISSDVTAVAADATDIGTVSTNISNVNAVAGNATNINAVAGNATNINAVAADAADIGTVAGISANVTTVAGLSSSVSTLALISSDITTVAGISANVTTVAGDTANIATIATNLNGTDTIGTVAGSISNVNSVGGSISNVNTVATNLSSINDFADKYRIGATDPTTDLDEGDLFYNTTSDTLKVYNGTAWEAGVTAGSGFLPTTGGSITGNLTVSDDFTVDTNTLYVDSTNNNVGIGTNSPSNFSGYTTLDVVNATNGGAILARGSTVEARFVADDPTGTVQVKAQSNHPLMFATSGTERMRINSSGNVGIGTSSPSRKVHVNGSARFDMTAGTIRISEQSSKVSVQATNSAENAFTDLKLDGGNLLLQTQSGGNVGIGTTNPSTAKLEVHGLTSINGNAPASDYALNITGSSGVNGGLVCFDSTVSASTTLVTTTSGGYLNVRENLPLHFNTNNTERMRIDGSGNVGIGTSSIASGGAGTTNLNVHTPSATSTYLKLSNTGTGNTASDGFDLSVDSSGNAYLINRENGFLGLYTNATERMRIDSSGNLLVGTTSTSIVGSGGLAAKPQVSGVRLDVSNSGGATMLLDRRTNDGEIINFYKDGSTVGSISTTSGDIEINSASGANKNVDIIGRDSGGNARGIVVGSGSAKPNADNAIDFGASSYRFKDAYFSGTVNAANFNTTSDATLKTNVETLTGSLDAVKALRGVSFDWIDNGNSEVGVIAQEVEAIVPDVVSTNDQGIKSVKYGNLVGVLIEAIKEQQAQIDELKAKLGD